MDSRRCCIEVLVRAESTRADTMGRSSSTRGNLCRQGTVWGSAATAQQRSTATEQGARKHGGPSRQGGASQQRDHCGRGGRSKSHVVAQRH